MNREITGELKVPGVDDFEILWIIQTYFKTAMSTPENFVVYPASNKYALRIHYEKGTICTIESGEGFDDGQLEDLKKEIHEKLVYSSGIQIERSILFSSESVTGYFKALSELIQILPAPENAPRPPVLMADHPFLIEYPISASSEVAVTNLRRMKAEFEWTWFLNAILRTHIKNIGLRPKHFWALCRDDKYSKEVNWCQEFYDIEGFKSWGQSFTDPADLKKIEIISHDDYYYSEKGFTGAPLFLPSSLELIISKIHNLRGERRRRLVRSVQWIYAANFSWVHHASSYFTSLVVAIESLIEPQASSGRCPQCNKELGPGPTRKFQDFVEAHTKTDVRTEQSKKKIYGVRSAMTHHGKMFQIDEAPWDWSMSKSTIEEDDIRKNLSRLVQEVVINWLLKN